LRLPARELAGQQQPAPGFGLGSEVSWHHASACPWADLWCKIMSTTSIISFMNLGLSILVTIMCLILQSSNDLTYPPHTASSISPDL
uniref:Uncharacterized protein n=1 Tax=Cairina moschata TaxID=8855 RepID=A0A8C3BCU4_CAIMO